MAFLIFKVNEAAVVSELCVEKDLEVNNCKGSCYLKEKLGLSDNSQEQNKRPLTIQVQDLTFLESPYLNLPYRADYRAEHPFYYLLFFSKGIRNLCWKPPRLV